MQPSRRRVGPAHCATPPGMVVSATILRSLPNDRDARPRRAPGRRLRRRCRAGAPRRVIVLAGCLIAMISFGPRSAMGFFTNEMSVDRGWALAIFSLSAAIQNILWGIGQPFAGALADRFGVTRVLIVGAVLYAAGPRLDGPRRRPVVAPHVGGRPDRLRPRRLLVQSGAGGVRQAPAAVVAADGARRRLGGGLVRPVPVRAARGVPEGRHRLGSDADAVRRGRC